MEFEAPLPEDMRVLAWRMAPQEDDEELFSRLFGDSENGLEPVAGQDRPESNIKTERKESVSNVKELAREADEHDQTAMRQEEKLDSLRKQIAELEASAKKERSEATRKREAVKKGTTDVQVAIATTNEDGKPQMSTRQRLEASFRSTDYNSKQRHVPI